MYVRPYLEDPVWLQPDDDEIEMLYDAALVKQETSTGEKLLPPRQKYKYHYTHDLPGDPDLENPESSDSYSDSDMSVVSSDSENEISESE